MSDYRSIIIVGGGIAGTNAAHNLRNEGYQGKIILFDLALDMPYDRPPLSKEYMLDEMDEQNILLFDATKYKELNIELKLGVEITSIDVENKEVITKDDQRYPWGKLLLATGSTLRQLRLEGSSLENIFYLKTFNDAKKIKEKLANINEIVIVGAGFIGGELASACRNQGIDVTIIERSNLPMAHIFGEEMGSYFLDLHKKNQVEVITNDSVKAFYGHSKIEEVATVSGNTIPCQAVVIGVGVDPNISLTSLTHESLDVERGYVINEFGETNIPDIYAAGDCVMWPYKEAHINVAHWDHAVNHGKAVAKNMVDDQSERYERVPYFWSDQYGSRFQYVGNCKTWYSTVLRGDKDAGTFTYFYLNENNVVLAAMIVNEPKNVLAIRRLIAKERSVDMDVLQNNEVSLKKV